MQDYFLESLKLQRIDFFVKLVAASECDDEEKRLAIQWVSELTDELMAKIRTHEYNRSMDLPSQAQERCWRQDLILTLARLNNEPCEALVLLCMSMLHENA